MKTLRTVLVGLVSLGALSSVQAKMIDLGALDTVSVFGNIIGTAESFGDQVQFTLNTGSDLEGFFAHYFVNDFGVELQRQISSGWEVVGSSFASEFSFDNLSAGNYRFDVSGQSFLNRNGAWGAAVMVAAVPEAETWLMMLIGAALIAYQLRRKQRTLPAQSFAATA